MNELDSLLDQILGRDLAHGGEGIDGPVWAALTRTGLGRVGIAESLGGSGGDLHDAATVTIRAAAAGLALPLAESLFTVGYLANRLAMEVPAGTVTAAVDGGTVPWGADAAEIWLLVPSDGGHRIARLVAGEWTATRARNLAGEPRDRISVDAALLRERGRVVDDDVPAGLALFGALGRSCQLLGALRTSLRLSREHVRVRRQFGAPLAAHQVVRHELAAMATEVAAVEAAVRHAIDRVGTRPDTAATLAVAAAKVQASTSATRVARAAHQLHGAVGITAEHPLHHLTTRLWSWRDEHGSATRWSARIAELVHTEYAADLWAALTDQTNGAA